VAGRRVVISSDGGRMRLRENKRGPKTKKGRRRYTGAWREPKVLIVYVVDAEGKREARFAPVIDATLKGPDAVFALLRTYLQRLGIAQADQVLFIADGAPWIWKRVPLLVQALGLAAEGLHLAVCACTKADVEAKVKEIARATGAKVIGVPGGLEPQYLRRGKRKRSASNPNRYEAFMKSSDRDKPVGGAMGNRRRRKILSSMFVVTGLLAGILGTACGNITVANGDYRGVLAGWMILAVIATIFFGFAIRLDNRWVRWIAMALLAATWLTGIDSAGRLIQLYSN